MLRTTTRKSASRSALAMTFACLMAATVGCETTMPDREVRMDRGYVYYLDGAGGGQPWSNWSGGVRSGLQNSDYDGAGEMYTWQTGMGTGADQIASDEYKRGKAGELAKKIQEYHAEHPEATINLMGLSAGTAVAVYTVEALPANFKVDNVVLLSGSLSSTHDLTPTLLRLKGKLYIFTSQNDAVLRILIPQGGAADRDATTTDTVGRQGARLPAGATADTRRLYRAKVVHIPYNSEFASYGHHGGHTDSVKGPFVQHFVAPLVTTASTSGPVKAIAPPSGKVGNPDYRRWARFAPGSFVVLEGYQTVNGVQTPIRLKSTLVSRDRHAVSVERVFQQAKGSHAGTLVPRRLFVTAAIDPNSHPMTHPASQIQETGSESFTIKNRKFMCEGKSVKTTTEFPNWGKYVNGSVYTTPELPGGIAKIHITMQLNGQSVEFAVHAVDFHIASR